MFKAALVQLQSLGVSIVLSALMNKPESVNHVKAKKKPPRGRLSALFFVSFLTRKAS